MSDRDVECEACGTTGRRPWVHPAPRDWLYLETECDAETVLVHACSWACAAQLWKLGPGERWTAAELDEAAKPTRAEAVEAAARGLLDALPRCSEVKCDDPAVFVEYGFEGSTDYLCPEHARQYNVTCEVPWADAVPAQRRELNGRGGGDG